MERLTEGNLTITKRLEFDAGHRLPDHSSKCRHLHGHRYALEVTLTGEVGHQTGDSSEGMLLDFSDVKKIAEEEVAQPWDHAFLVYKNDEVLVNFLETLKDHKTVVLPVVPTVENLARLAYEKLSAAYQKVDGGLILSNVRLYETPNSWAEVSTK